MAPIKAWSIALAALQIACGAASTAPPVTAPLATFQSPHFRFDYPAADAVHISGAAARLEQEYDRIFRLKPEATPDRGYDRLTT